jgi:alkylation response protein AidB-like acyl-CoA dehydrogenase
VREGDDWIVNGLKTRVANGGMAGFYCVLVRTDPDAAPEKGLSLILVEGDRPGVVCENPRDKLGMRLTPETDLRLEGVRVPGANLIGEEGRGLGQVRRFYEEAWIQVSAMALGAARGAFARALEYARKRMQFGRPIAGFQAIRHKIADMAAQVEQTAAAVYRSAAGFDQQAGTPALAAMTKLCACDAALHVSSEAIQILGGYGYMKEYEVERFYRDAKALSFFCGGRGFLKDFAAAAVIDKIR